MALSVTNSAPDSIDALLAKQLSLETGDEWSNSAAALLSDAARAFRAKLEGAQMCSTAVAFAESLFHVVAPGDIYKFPQVHCSTKEASELIWVSGLFAKIFNISDQTATALAVFTNNQVLDNQGGVVTEDMIKGLVSTNDQIESQPVVANTVVRSEAVEMIGNPEELLRLRDKSSIIDSISKHIPEIKSLYKRSYEYGNLYT